jgi:hypothetical protein
MVDDMFAYVYNLCMDTRMLGGGYSRAGVCKRSGWSTTCSPVHYMFTYPSQSLLYISAAFRFQFLGSSPPGRSGVIGLGRSETFCLDCGKVRSDTVDRP